MADDRIATTYESVRQEFNESTFATGHGLRQDFLRLHLIEIETVSRYLPPDGTFLDIGTGNGMVPSAIRRLFPDSRIVTVDFSDTGGTEALERLRESGIDGHFCEVGAEPLPLADGSVDFVFAGNVIEHLPHSPKPFLTELVRVLKPGGHLLVDTKNAIDLKTRIKFLFGIYNWPEIEGIFHTEKNIHHHKEYNLGKLQKAVAWSGLIPVEAVAAESFFHQSLKRMGSLKQMGTDGSRRSEFSSGFNPFHPYEYFRIVCLGLVTLFPALRSEILVVGRRPDTAG